MDTTLLERKRNTGHDGPARMVRSPPVAVARAGAHCIDVIAMRAVPMSDHDLPVVAAEQQADAPQRPDWASLLDDGVQPALILGAERRSSGQR